MSEQDAARTESVEGFRLSPQQYHLWRLAGGDPGAPYRVACAVRAEGELDHRALESAVADLVERHEILRTSFRRPAGVSVPLQVIHPEAGPHLEVHDLSHLEGEDLERAVAAVEESFAALPLGLERPSQLAVAVVRPAAGVYRLLFSLPALCGDGRGLVNLVRELALAYAGGGEPEAEAVQYADLAEVFNELLEAEDTEAGREVWRKRLAEAPAAPAALPREREGEPGAPYAPQVVAGTAAREAGALREAADEGFGASLADLCLACFGVLLWRCDPERGAVVDAAFDGRTYEGLDQALGLCARYLPVPVSPAAGRSWAAVVEAVREEAAEVSGWQDYFSREAEGLEGSVPPHPRYAFDFHPRVELPAAGDLALSLETVRAVVDRAALRLSCREEEDGRLRAEVVYDPRCLGEEDARNLLDGFLLLLDAAADAPGGAVDAAEVVGEEERRRLLRDFNDTGVAFDDLAPVHELFEAQAVRTPESVALVDERGRHLSYAELDRRADRLARHLRSLGVAPGTAVPVAMERSAEMVLAFLGIWKAGGAYVPLDPGYPEQRLALMLAEAGSPLLLTQARVEDEIPAGGARVLTLDREWGSIPADGEGRPGSGACLDDLAYVIYTSGSTGRPKGVMVPHRAIVNRLLWMLHAFGWSGDDHLLQKTPASFDASIWELFVPLAAGARLVLARPGGHQDSEYLVRQVIRHRITALQLVPSLLQAFLSEPEVWRCDCLARLFCGGEVFPAGLAQRCFDTLPVALHNLYGPTETAIDATSWSCRPGEDEVPIGHPLANVRVYLLDRHLHPVPTGVPGEIFVGGPGLARGYLGRPGGTALRFVPSPFAAVPGERLYRTGDLARHRRGGGLAFLGRGDHQVKIRGYRIELGEVEAALGRHPEVREAAVRAGGGPSREGVGETRLVGYVVPAGDEAPAQAELRHFLERILPRFMVPAVFVPLPALPRLSSGKVDRNALPEPGDPASRSEGGRGGPRTPVEEILASIWSNLLKVEEVGIDADFFELGGHSLLATQAISRLRDNFGVEVSLRTLFESPTVEAMAREVEEVMRAGGNLELPPLRSIPRGGELPLSFAQQRLWFVEQLQPGSSAYNVPTAVRMRGPLDHRALGRSLSGVARRHETLRTSFPSHEGRPLQHITRPAPVPLPVVDLTGLAADRREALVLALADREARSPFDLATGPLLRARLLRVDAEDHAALLTMHHIGSDGWSAGILVREVTAHYAAFKTGETPLLPELPVQYADFAHWQRRWLRGEALEAKVEYWRRQLAGAPPVTSLPTDRPRPAKQSFRGTTVSFTIPGLSAARVRAASREAGCTLFMTFLAVFKGLLSRYSGDRDLSIGTPIAGRNWAEIEDLIGFFVNTLVLRTDLTGAPSFRELQARVREVALEGHAQQDVPFEKLVEELAPERTLSHSPLFQVMFGLDVAPPSSEVMPGLTVTLVPVENETAKFDMTLSMLDRGDRITGSLEYKTDLFDATTARRVLEHLTVLTAGCVEHPDRSLWELPLTTPGESQQVLVEWNDTEAPVPAVETFHHLFEARAALSSEAVAVVFGRRHLTYGGLDRRSNRLARYLRDWGVEAESRVGVALERSPELVLAILGVLKAGGAFLPLDPNVPLDRFSYMLEDARVAILVTQESLLDQLPAGMLFPIQIDADWEMIAAQDAGALDLPGRAGDLAYVIYTSGSTGKPKGVMVSHRGLPNLSAEQCRCFGAGPGSRMLQFSSLSFDACVFELVMALGSGATLELGRMEELLPGPELLGFLARRAVTLVTMPPSALGSMATADLPQLATVTVAGEACGADVVAAWAPGRRFFNLYGPTETTIWATWEECRPGEGTPSIGRPVGNFQAHLADARMRPVPAGAPGMLLVGGVGLARGYLNRPGLTAASFLPDPFGGGEGARLYRTGDLARARHDGSLEFLGRTDHQIKLRGYRIELGEIEAVLGEHSAVSEAAVLLRRDDPANAALVAYVVPVERALPASSEGREHSEGWATEAALDVAELRDYLRTSLPEYMVPTAFAVLRAMPRTPSGKLDRRALKAPGDALAEAVGPYVAPRTPLEEVLADLWRELLGVERVGVEDSFFDLGGHSLLATQFVNKLQSTFSVEVPVGAVFETPTLGGFAESLVSLVPRPEQVEAVAKALVKMAQLSPEEMEAMLAEKRGAPVGGEA